MTQNYPYANPAFAAPVNGAPMPVRSPSQGLSPPTTPNMQNRAGSPSLQQEAHHSSRRAKRHYPTYVQQQPMPPSPMQQPPMPQPQPVMPTPSNNDYAASAAGLANGVANMNLYNNAPPNPARDDVALVGQAPLINDLDMAPPTAHVPQHVRYHCLKDTDWRLIRVLMWIDDSYTISSCSIQFDFYTFDIKCSAFLQRIIEKEQTSFGSFTRTLSFSQCKSISITH